MRRVHGARRHCAGRRLTERPLVRHAHRASAGILYPIWPTQLRVAVYYVAIAVLAVALLFLLLCALRWMLYATGRRPMRASWPGRHRAASPSLTHASVTAAPVWCVSFGRWTLWILPNLLADVGFRASFTPAYELTIRTAEPPEPSEPQRAAADGSSAKVARPT